MNNDFILKISGEDYQIKSIEIVEESIRDPIVVGSKWVLFFNKKVTTKEIYEKLNEFLDEYGI